MFNARNPIFWNAARPFPTDSHWFCACTQSQMPLRRCVRIQILQCIYTNAFTCIYIDKYISIRIWMYMAVSENCGVSKACCIRGYDRGMFRGMIRGMIRPRLFTVYTNIPLLRRRSSSHSLFLKGPTGPWHSKARFRYDSGYVSGMIPGVIRACNCFWKNRKTYSCVKYFQNNAHLVY